MKISHLFFAALCCILLFSQCSEEEKEFVPDVSDIELGNKVVRMDQLMYAADSDNITTELKKWKDDYPEFYDIYFSRVRTFPKSEKSFPEEVALYLSDSVIQKMNADVAKEYKDFDSEAGAELLKSMKIFKYYFPDFEAPNIYTFTSFYANQFFLFEDADRDAVGIGLDMFLEDFDYKAMDPQNEAFSDYLTRTFNSQHINKKIMEILTEEYIGGAPGSRMLDQMIHNGKRLFILDKVLAGTPDSVLLEYTEAQTEWVKNNELEMWAFFFDENLFYESNSMKIGKYLLPAPSSPGMPENAPGRTANYVGWQIVKAYMKRFPKTTLQELINEKDAQKIMDKSRYKPKKR